MVNLLQEAGSLHGLAVVCVSVLDVVGGRAYDLPTTAAAYFMVDGGSASPTVLAGDAPHPACTLTNQRCLAVSRMTTVALVASGHTCVAVLGKLSIPARWDGHLALWEKHQNQQHALPELFHVYGMFNGGFQLPWSCYLQSVVADPHLLIIQVPIIVASRVHGRPLCQYATATSNTLGCFEARAALEECLHTLSPKMCTDSMPGGAVRLLNLIKLIGHQGEGPGGQDQIHPSRWYPNHQLPPTLAPPIPQPHRGQGVLPVQLWRRAGGRLPRQ